MKTNSLLKFLLAYTPFWMTIPALALILCGIIGSALWGIFTLIDLSFTTPAGWLICSVLACISTRQVHKNKECKKTVDLGIIEYFIAFIAGPVYIWFVTLMMLGVILFAFFMIPAVPKTKTA